MQYERELGRKLKNREMLTEDDVRALLYDYEYESETGEVNRWTIDMYSIIEWSDGSFYSIYWRRGATEYQENEYFTQIATPVHQVTKTIVVTEWEEITDNEQAQP